jgi:2-octaprenylphenol hydroxylase
MNKQLNIAIVGAGVTGLTLAALLAGGKHGRRLRITVIDAAPRPVHDMDSDIGLRVSAIAVGSAELLNSVAAWDYVAAARIGPYDRMRVWDEHGSPESSNTLRFDAAEFGVNELGFIVENDLLRHALLEQLDATNIELCFDSPLDTVERDGTKMRLRLASERTLDADLVVGADGARSFVRQSFAIETQDWPYGQTAVVTHLRPEKSHRNTAWQRFLRAGPLGMLPLPDGRISVVWSTTEETAEQAMAADDDVLGDMLTTASDHALGKLTVAGARGAFPLCARHAQKYVLPGVALIGDAAHAVHPLAGQGANLGLQDAATLAEIISDAVASGAYIGDRPVLRRYERARKGSNATMMHLMTGLNGLFATDSAVLGEMRAIGMRLFNHSGPIREHAVKVALGVGRTGVGR